MQKFITAGGFSLRMADTDNEAPVVVLLHGYLESLDIWDDVTTLLCPALRVIAIDIPGHGISEVRAGGHGMAAMADVVHAAVRCVWSGKYVVAGHSMGGYIALELLNRHGGDLSGIVLLHSTPNADTEEKRHNRQREIEIVRSGKKDLLAQSAANGFAADNRRRMSSVIKDMEELIQMTDEEGIIALLEGMSARADLNQVLSDSAIPKLLVYGRKDEYIPEAVAQAVIDKNPDATVLWLGNSGHNGFLEEPEAIAEAIREFCFSIGK